MNLAYNTYTYYMCSMITKHDDLLGTLIHDVAHLLRLDIDRRLDGHNLTRVKWLALGILNRKGALTQVELADVMELGSASVGRLVDRLVDRGFVERRQDPEDRRAYRLFLTKDALTLLGELDGIGAELRKDTLGALSEQEVSSLNSGLLKIKFNLQARSAALALAVGLLAHKTSTYSNAVTDLAVSI